MVGNSFALGAESNDIVAIEQTIPLRPQLRYFLLPPAKVVTQPEAGFGLALILPGGDGGEDFLTFAKQMRSMGIPSDFVAAQLVAPKWTDKQEVTWPTAFLKEKGMKYSTEEFVEAVIDEVQKKNKIDSRCIFTVSWSSSGPAAYAVALTSKRITGSFVAMSVFRPDWLPDLAQAKKRSFFLYHSPQDQVCSYFFAQRAKLLLTQNGANVELFTYSGGHGWLPYTFYMDTIKDGIEWLRSRNAQPTK
jgi:predicted esterase